MNEYKRHAFVKWDDNGRWLSSPGYMIWEEAAREITEKEWEKMLHVLGLTQKKKSKKCVFDE